MTNKRLILVALIASLITVWSCNSEKGKSDFVEEALMKASNQIGVQLNEIELSGKVLNPRTIEKDGSTQYVGIEDWTSGFFSGTMWYLYEMTGQEKWKDYGVKITESLDSVKYLTWHHDVGFMINCSFGNAFRLTGEQEYKEVMIKAAESLCTRFHPAAGVTQSWNVDRGWQATRGWMCPVIIDNMMNLELLFKVTEMTGDSSFYKVAISHADETMANHFREDFSSWHVVDYDPNTGEVRQKNTAQGYSDDSAWARGQAWGLYGYAVCFRATKDSRYLKQAENIADFILNHPRLPEDGVPYWDFDAPNIPNEPRDASAAAIIASALYELSSYSVKSEEYVKAADHILQSLSSPAYSAEVGTNNGFILKHSVGSIPHGVEIDVPLNYADYYYLEAIRRKMNLKK